MEYTAYISYSVVKLQEPNKNHAVIKRNEDNVLVGKQNEKNHFKN